MTPRSVSPIDVGSDGVAVLSISCPDRGLNALSTQVPQDLRAAIEFVAAEADVIGAVIVIGRAADSSYLDDLKVLLDVLDDRIEVDDAYKRASEFSAACRAVETCGKPVACMIPGPALSAACDVALASHFRVIASDAEAVMGFPDVTLGMLPAGGGTQRLSRMVGIQSALELLLDGQPVKPDELRRLGIVDEVAATADLLCIARQWVRTSQDARRPWDRKGFCIPGGSTLIQPEISAYLSAAVGKVTKRTLGNYPAPEALLSCVFEGSQVPFDVACRLESKYLARLLTGPVPKHLIRAQVNRIAAERLIRRPHEIRRRQVDRIGILGAGMMGSGIAHVAVMNGLEVVLLDAATEGAERGKERIRHVLIREAAISQGTEPATEDMLRRIHPTSNYRDLAECDLIIEAVFEQRAIKAEVTRKVETVTKPETVLASNTSTIAISELAEASIRPEQFIGMHFFSPVERMPLIEIIVGKKTTQETLARALDFARQLGKTPIVVNDAPGFYTSRCFSTYTTEGQLMLTEGVAPALIENAGRAAGMPVGPLAVADEVSLSLRYDVLRAAMQANGSSGDPPLGWELVRHFVEDLNRTGKKSGAGFYEYPAGRRKFLWPGLAKEYPPSPKQPSSESVQRRLLYVQALEAARCFESGVVTSPAEADLGSLLAWGFPRWTGGTLSYIDSIGIRVFVENCLDLAKQHGERFRPQQALLDRAERAESFYQDRRRDDALISRMSLHDE